MKARREARLLRVAGGIARRAWGAGHALRVAGHDGRVPCVPGSQGIKGESGEREVRVPELMAACASKICSTHPAAGKLEARPGSLPWCTHAHADAAEQADGW